MRGKNRISYCSTVLLLWMLQQSIGQIPDMNASEDYFQIYRSHPAAFSTCWCFTWGAEMMRWRESGSTQLHPLSSATQPQNLTQDGPVTEELSCIHEQTYLLMVAQNPAGVCSTGSCSLCDGDTPPSKLPIWTMRDFFVGGTKKQAAKNCHDSSQSIWTMRNFFVGGTKKQAAKNCHDSSQSNKVGDIPHVDDFKTKYWPELERDCQLRSRDSYLEDHWTNQAKCCVKHEQFPENVAAKYYYQQVWDLFVSGDVSKFIDDTINKLVDSHGEFHTPTPNEVEKKAGVNLFLGCKMLGTECYLTSVGLCYSCCVNTSDDSKYNCVPPDPDFRKPNIQKSLKEAPGKLSSCPINTRNKQVPWNTLDDEFSCYAAQKKCSNSIKYKKYTQKLGD